MALPEKKYDKLIAILKEFDHLAIAFSGGADSTFLLHTAAQHISPPLLALFADSQVQPPGEAAHAENLARKIGCEFRLVEVDVLTVPGFVNNPPNRCYLCKKAVYRQFLSIAGSEGIHHLADGTNVDDTKTDRPGLVALQEYGICTPLAQAGLTKKEIRYLSKKFGLRTWNKHSASCLATRLATGDLITVDKLRLIAETEAFLHGCGFLGCRVRFADNVVFLELTDGDSQKFLKRAVHAELKKKLFSHGIRKVFLDLSERVGIVT